MKKQRSARITLFVLAILVLSGVLAVSNSVALAEAKAPIVRFTIINESQHPFTLHLYGSEDHSITVEGRSHGILFVKRGDYHFWMRACNQVKTGVFDLSITMTMHVPVCGGNAGAIGDKQLHIDVSDYIKMVNVKIRNKTKEKVGVYVRTDENHYFLNLKPGEVIYQIMPRDMYRVSYVACGELVVDEYKALKFVPLDLKCP